MTTNDPTATRKATCGAQTRRGTPCASTILYRNGRCHMHGGPSLNGASAPAFKHGRYSRYMGAPLLERIEAAAEDPDLQSVRLDLALVDVMLGDLVSGLDERGTAALWRALRAEWARYTTARDGGSVTAMAASLDGLGALIGAGAADADSRDEISRRLEDRRRLLDHEVKRTAALQNAIPAERVLAIIAALIGIVMRYVPDADVQAAIRRDTQQLLGTGAG